MATRSRTPPGETSKTPVRTAPINEAPGNMDADLDAAERNEAGSTQQDQDTDAQVVSSRLEQREIPSFSEDRETRIAEAAYWRAERRGFQAGSELDDWLAAEKEIDGRKEDTSGPA